MQKYRRNFWNIVSTRKRVHRIITIIIIIVIIKKPDIFRTFALRVPLQISGRVLVLNSEKLTSKNDTYKVPPRRDSESKMLPDETLGPVFITRTKKL